MKQSAARWTRLLASACLLLATAVRARAGDDRGGAILVSALTEEDRASAARLAELVDEPLALVEDPSAREPAHACELARASGRPVFAILDGAARRVHVVRARDCMVLTRAIEGAELTPYTAAFVTAELLTLARQLEQSPALREPATPVAPLDVSFSAGIDIPILGPYRPRALLLGGLTWRGLRSPLGVDVAALAGIEAGADEPSALGRVRAQKTDLALRAGPAFGGRRALLFGFAQVGLALTAVNLWGEADRRASLVLGGGLGGRVRLVGPLALFLQASCAGGAPRRDYLVQGSSVLREPLLTLNLELGLSVYLHSR